MFRGDKSPTCPLFGCGRQAGSLPHVRRFERVDSLTALRSSTNDSHTGKTRGSGEQETCDLRDSRTVKNVEVQMIDGLLEPGLGCLRWLRHAIFHAL